MTAKRFTNIEHDYENAWIKCNDDGDFMIYAIYKELDESLPSLEDLLNGLSEENEQLKTTIQQLTNDNTKQKKKLNTTMKENEQLKCGNKNLKATLNDFINICNRLQANPTDKQTLGVARDMLQNMGVDLE